MSTYSGSPTGARARTTVFTVTAYALLLEACTGFTAPTAGTFVSVPTAGAYMDQHVPHKHLPQYIPTVMADALCIAPTAMVFGSAPTESAHVHVLDLTMDEFAVVGIPNTTLWS